MNPTQQNDWVAVSFEESECVVAFGTKKTTFRVRLEQAWTEVSRVASAIVRNPGSAPGVVWSRVVEVRVPIGTEVERCIDAPSQQRHASTFESLVRSAPTHKVVCRRDRFFVARNGRLSPSKTKK